MGIATNGKLSYDIYSVTKGRVVCSPLSKGSECSPVPKGGESSPAPQFQRAGSARRSQRAGIGASRCASLMRPARCSLVRCCRRSRRRLGGSVVCFGFRALALSRAWRRGCAFCALLLLAARLRFSPRPLVLAASWRGRRWRGSSPPSLGPRFIGGAGRPASACVFVLLCRVPNGAVHAGPLRLCITV